uniref:Uncharacterized protein n=1 Tax=Romanomermis culicivorax TaxID=13658 RepID=A0A915HYJ3_ROMCU
MELNLTNMNMDDYFDDATGELMDDRYLQGYEADLDNRMQQEDQKEKIDPKDQRINRLEMKAELFIRSF